LRARHDFEHGFPLIRSPRASAQRSTSVLFSFVLSLIVAALFTIRQSKTSYDFQTTYTQNMYARQAGTSVQRFWRDPQSAATLDRMVAHRELDRRNEDKNGVVFRRKRSGKNAT
jgi:hypothetical protein